MNLSISILMPAVKMDIQGAEYAVLEEVVRNRTILLVYDLLVEFHTHQLTENGVLSSSAGNRKSAKTLLLHPFISWTGYNIIFKILIGLFQRLQVSPGPLNLNIRTKKIDIAPAR
jgi:hypothetical protein